MQIHARVLNHIFLSSYVLLHLIQTFHLSNQYYSSDVTDTCELTLFTSKKLIFHISAIKTLIMARY